MGNNFSYILFENAKIFELYLNNIYLIFDIF